MAEKFNLSYNDDTVSSTVLLKDNLTDYTSYSVYVEKENPADEPLEGTYVLYSLFNAGINNISADNWELTVSERVTSQTQFLSRDNYDQITSIFGNVTPEIDYDGINSLLSKLDYKNSFSDISSEIFKWLSKFVNFSVNKNPENADETNLILVQSLLKKDNNGHCYIQDITESILNKIFRNLIQLIRAKHEYRLYGEGTTILGGKATELSSQTKLSQWSGLSPSCWQEFSGNYIVGKTVYGGEPISQISSTKPGSFNMNSYSCYGVASHTHEVTIPNINNGIPSKVSLERESYEIVSSYTQESIKKDARLVEPDQNGNDWESLARATIIGNPAGYADGSTKDGKVMGGGDWSYGWNSKNCKLPAVDDMKTDIFGKKNTILPTYSSYVWQWTGTDDTNITSPRQYITERDV